MKSSVALARERDFGDHQKDNLLEMAMLEARRAGAHPDDARKMGQIVQAVTGRAGASSIFGRDLAPVGAALQTYGNLGLLTHTTFSSVTEPVTMMMRTGDFKATMHTFGKFLGEAVRGAKSTREISEFASAIGLTVGTLHDTVASNRLGYEFNPSEFGSVTSQRAFRANWLTGITNAQKRATVSGGFYWMRELAKRYHDPQSDKISKRIAEAEFKELGIPAEHMDSFLDWLRDKNTDPTVDDLRTPQGRMFGDAIYRFTTQVIQEPTKFNKAYWSTQNAWGRAAFALTSFLYSFYRNVHAQAANATIRDYKLAREEGYDKKSSAAIGSVPALTRLGAGFGLMFAGQLVSSAFREAVLNSEQFDQHEKDGTLFSWLAGLAFSRTSVLGPVDPFYQTVRSLQYHRDFASLTAGAQLNFIGTQLYSIIKGLSDDPGLNSPNTNAAERRAARAAYRLAIGPVMVWAASRIPTVGPLTSTLRFGAVNAVSSNTAAEGFADATVGPPSARRHSGNAITPMEQFERDKRKWLGQD